MLPLLLLPLSVGSEPPAFTVTNKVPPFVVVNKVPPKKADPSCPCDVCPCVLKNPATPCPAACGAAPTYADVLARVQSGETVEFTAPLAGFPGEPGAYRCWLENGTPVMQRKGVAVTTAQPFRGGGLPFDADHTCDQCGRSQYVVERLLPSGRHVHTCARCGNSWQH
jgi:hypothetical protein